MIGDQAGGIQRSSDGGANWTSSRVLLGGGAAAAVMAFAELADGRILAAGNSGVITASADDGATFERVPSDERRSFLCATPCTGGVLLGQSGKRSAVFLVRTLQS